MTIIIVSRMIPLRLKTRISYWDLCIVSQLLHSLSTISTKKQSIDWHIIITNWLELQTEEKTSGNISSGLAKAVTASLTIKSNADSIKSIEDKYYRPENCENVCPRCSFCQLYNMYHTFKKRFLDILHFGILFVCLSI
jgi:hypothetical protein